MTRRRNTSERRRQIAQALMRVMATTGYDGATIAGIAREAGLASGLVHYHFKNKREVLLHMLELLQGAHHTLLAEAISAAGTDASKQLEAFLDVHLATGSTADPAAMAAWVQVGVEAQRDALVGEAYAASLGRGATTLRDIITQGEAQGVFAPDDREASVAGLISLIQGFYGVAAVARALIPHRSAAPSARAMARGLLNWWPTTPPRRNNQQE